MESFNLDGIHYRQELVKCGKPACKRCPHGPYWYAYHYLRIFLKKTYVGKHLPNKVQEARPRWTAPPADIEEQIAAGRRSAGRN